MSLRSRVSGFVAVAAASALALTVAWEADAAPARLPERVAQPQNIIVEKTDGDGRLLPGGVFLGYNCVNVSNSGEWICEDLADYPWFNGTEGEAGLRRSGSTQDGFVNDIPLRGGWTTPIQHCLILGEVTAPDGYLLRDRPALLCRGEGGWTVENASSAVPEGLAVGGHTYLPGLGDWTVSNTLVPAQTPDGADYQVATSVFRLVNHKRPKPPAPTPSATPDPCRATASSATGCPRGIGANTSLDDGAPVDADGD